MKKFAAILLAMLLLFSLLSGCAEAVMPQPENPVTLTMWHVYGSQTKSPLNDIIDLFNRTVGQENGITVNVESVTSSSAIDQALAASANNEPGAQNMPDLFTAYPRVAQIVGQDRLLDWNDYFTQQELSALKQDFLAEGYFDEALLMLPIAKSTEALYVNQTLFDRFCLDTGSSLDALRSFAGVFDTAMAYYDWSGGQSFMQLNDFYHYAYMGMKAQGSEFIRDGRLCVDEPAFAEIWQPLAQAAIYGGICLEDGYAASRWKTAEVIANTGSTADVLYQPDEVIYPDNTSEPITALALPYPTFDDAFAGVIYRGGGLFAVKNQDPRKNQAACIFAKWLIQAENNLGFVTQAGYLPVTDQAFAQLVADIRMVENEKFHSVYTAVEAMLETYDFYALPLFPQASDVQLAFEKNVKAVLKTARNQYIQQLSQGQEPQQVMEQLIAATLSELQLLSAG